jgi:hypothetical protein
MTAEDLKFRSLVDERCDRQQDRLLAHDHLPGIEAFRDHQALGACDGAATPPTYSIATSSTTGGQAFTSGSQKR